MTLGGVYLIRTLTRGHGQTKACGSIINSTRLLASKRTHSFSGALVRLASRVGVSKDIQLQIDLRLPSWTGRNGTLANRFNFPVFIR